MTNFESTSSDNKDKITTKSNGKKQKKRKQCSNETVKSKTTYKKK
jgi:hypothetical protein